MNDNNISDLTNQWIELLGSKPKQAIEFYCENIIPSLLPQLKKEFANTYQQNNKYDCLISLLGFTPETSVLAYQFCQPEKFIVLYTEESSTYLEKVVNYSKVPIYSFFHEKVIELPSNKGVYQALEAALQRVPKGSRVAIDLTGGKKIMSGALAVAAGVLDIDLIYIDFRDYMPEFRKPKPESSYIHLVTNPMKLSIDIFGDIEITRAVDFFNVGKYDISSQLFAEAGKSMSNPRMAEIFTNISDFYSCWNIFKFKEALQISSTLLDQILRFSFQMSPKFQFDIERLQKQRETINKLAEGDKDYILLNFYFTAERYERTSQHDIATLLYYRTIEGIFEKILEEGTENFDRSKPNYSLLKVDKEELRKKYISVRQKVYEHTSQQEPLPDKIAMFDAFCIIEALEKEFTNKFPINRVANIANIRNKSIYAHGIEPLTEKDVYTIRNFTREVMTKYLSIRKTGAIDSERDKFEFIKLEFKNH
ncbi:hypothetical protein K4039_27610 [Lyngbya sp. CCAP 1446/10]|uniref:hypothetical protein n=1 Tax=Lyngbya sp. CCAP 1446/10 TaxID=439293 RepID=UPI002238B615|nr:hypothetical protein [Lyngbya sp. CCAP 1446/10]MCW6053714.1 hypothetical protein [Lyngbya sp. CCAP 1446/10]